MLSMRKVCKIFLVLFLLFGSVQVSAEEEIKEDKTAQRLKGVLAIAGGYVAMIGAFAVFALTKREKERQEKEKEKEEAEHPEKKKIPESPIKNPFDISDLFKF